MLLDQEWTAHYLWRNDIELYQSIAIRSAWICTELTFGFNPARNRWQPKRWTWLSVNLRWKQDTRSTGRIKKTWQGTDRSKQGITNASASRSHLLLMHDSDNRDGCTDDDDSSNGQTELETAILHLKHKGNKPTGGNQRTDTNNSRERIWGGRRKERERDYRMPRTKAIQAVQRCVRHTAGRSYMWVAWM